MRYINLLNQYPGKPVGNNYVLHCPFHRDNVASLYVHLDEGQWQCFSCLRKGWLDSLIAKLEHTDRNKAMAKIIKYNKNGKFVGRKFILAEKNRSILPESCLDDFWSAKSEAAKKYFLSRGFTLQFVKNFEFMEAPAYDFNWSGRVIYPIRDYDGNLVSIEGRIMDSSSEKLRYYKAKNSDSSAGLFGIQKAKNDLRKYVIVCEGAFDSMAVWKSGFKSVALCSSDISELQLRQLKRLASRVFVLYDGPGLGTDKSRSQVVHKALYSLGKNFREYSVVQIPERRTDPNDLFLRGELQGFIKKTFFLKK